MKSVNIVSGECAVEHVRALTQKPTIPFNEAMMDGSAPRPIFSADFCRLRAETHHVSPEAYAEKISPLLDVLDHLENFDELNLFFGPDAFCQLNLLTLLACLEERSYRGRVALTLMDDETHEIISPSRSLTLDGYGLVYDAVAEQRRPKRSCGSVMDHGIAMAFDYWDDQGTLLKLARANILLPHLELVKLLMEAGREYGLSDLQAEEIISRV